MVPIARQTEILDSHCGSEVTAADERLKTRGVEAGRRIWGVPGEKQLTKR
jgi:hypothetical protein